MEKVRVLVWNEFLHEKEDEKVRKVYPDGIHEAIAEGLRKCDNFEVKTATLDMPNFGLDDETLDNIDVLIWAKPSMGPKPTFGNVKPYENV
jgi:trehalose utilization protein